MHAALLATHHVALTATHTAHTAAHRRLRMNQTSNQQQTGNQGNFQIGFHSHVL
jgi:hypothetical protein